MICEKNKLYRIEDISLNLCASFAEEEFIYFYCSNEKLEYSELLKKIEEGACEKITDGNFFRNNKDLCNYPYIFCIVEEPSFSDLTL